MTTPELPERMTAEQFNRERLLVGGRSKYKNKFKIIDGHRFHSIKEADRYCALKLLQHAGKISRLKLQPKFELFADASPGKPVKVAIYVADFQYIETDTGETRIEDVKGMKTALYSLKKALFRANYGVEILET